MKVANLTRNTSSFTIVSLLADKSFHHTVVKNWGSCVVGFSTIKGICKDVIGSGMDAMVIDPKDELFWDSIKFDKDAFKGRVFVVTERSLRCIQEDKRALNSL